MSSRSRAAKQLWENSFDEQIAKQAFNTAPVEALVRTISYYLRDRYAADGVDQLHFMEMGCGAGPNLRWLAGKGMRVSGVDISPKALALARQNLGSAGIEERIGQLVEAPASETPFEAESFDGVIEACVFQHLDRDERLRAFAEVKRVLKPDGLFVGYMLDVGHTVFEKRKNEQLEGDPGTIILNDGRSKLYLTDIGISHFYRKDELISLLDGFSVVDPCLTTYYLPQDEAKRRGYDSYLQSMWTVYAVK